MMNFPGELKRFAPLLKGFEPSSRTFIRAGEICDGGSFFFDSHHFLRRPVRDIQAQFPRLGKKYPSQHFAPDCAQTMGGCQQTILGELS